MRRFTFGLGVAAVVFIVLAWVWPDGPDRRDDERASADRHASDSPSDDRTAGDGGSGDGPSASATGPSERDPSTAEPTVDPGTGPASDAYAGPLGTRDHTGSDALALTFDDGPDPNWTPKVLEALRERGVKATFCVIGAYAEANPDLIADIVHDGHTLCNHTWFHEFDLGTRGDGEIEANLRRTNDAILKAAPGADVRYFRHPGGRWTDRAIAVADALGMESLHWAVDPSDWDRETTEDEIHDRVLAGSGPGAIVLLHDGAANQRDMLAALERIFDEFERRGYALVRL